MSRAAPLRVLHVASGDLWAGAEVQVYQLLRSLASHEQVEVRAAVMNDGLLADRLRSGGVHVDVLDERRHAAPRLWLRLARIVRAWRPAVVHTHRRKEHVLGGLAAAFGRIPAVATVHGRPEFADRRDFRATVLRSVESLALRKLHRYVVAVSAEMLEHVERLAAASVVIRNAIDVDATRAAARSLDAVPSLRGASGGRLGFIGRLVPVKRVDRLIEATSLLNDRSPGRWSLHVIGDGPLRTALESQVAAAGLSEVVRFSGFQPNPLPLLKQLDLLLFASEHEGLPMTALEALALNVRVIAPPIGGLTELIGNERGRIAASGEPQAIAEAVALCAAEPALDVAVPERYTIGYCAARYLDLYRAVAAGAAAEWAHA